MNKKEIINYIDKAVKLQLSLQNKKVYHILVIMRNIYLYFLQNFINIVLLINTQKIQ